jgi:hypothetical protein
LNPFGVSHISFTVTTPSGQQTVVTNLRGHTQQGDTVTAHFTISPWAGPTVVSLVSYDAPGPTFDPSTASQQTLVQDATGTLGAGPQSLTVTIPSNYYQIDFVVGAAINQFGPAGSNIFYSAQWRLLSADNGGTNPVVQNNAGLSGTVFRDSHATATPTGNPGLSGVTVTLTGTTSSGQSVNLTTTTGSTGNYSFTGLYPGTYTLSITSSRAELATVGSDGGSTGGAAGIVSNINLSAGSLGTGYNFGETAIVV